MGIAGNAFGPLGVGMGYAMASKLAHPEKKVLLITGDGAFGYGIPEFDTCMRYGINITAIIFNDGLWGMIKRSEQRKAPNETKFVGLDLEQNTHYEKIVEGFGGYGELVTHIDELRPAIQRAVASGKPGCVNVIVDAKIGQKAQGAKNIAFLSITKNKILFLTNTLLYNHIKSTLHKIGAFLVKGRTQTLQLCEVLFYYTLTLQLIIPACG